MFYVYFTSKSGFTNRVRCESLEQALVIASNFPDSRVFDFYKGLFVDVPEKK